MNPSLSLMALGALVLLIPALAQNQVRHVREVTVAREGGNQPVPKWENGRMLAFDHDSQPPAVTIYGGDGEQLAKASIAIPNAARVWIHGLAAAPGGGAAVGGAAMKTDGTTVTFVAWIDSRGSIERLVRTPPLIPRRLCFASDGTLWAAVLGPADGKTEAPYNVLQHYDKAGRLLGSLLPSTELPRHGQEQPAEDSFLTASADRVAFYSASSRTYVEIGNSGTTLGRWNGLESGRDFTITGAGMVRGGDAYVSARRAIPGKAGHTSPEYFVLNRGTGTWTRLDAGGLYGAIDGTEDDQLIIGAGRSRYLWVSAKELLPYPNNLR